MGRKLKLTREKANYTQGSLANKLGVSRTSITNIEAGNQKIPLHMLYNIGALFEIDPRELLPSPGSVHVNSEINIIKSRNTVVDVGEKSAIYINELLIHNV